MPIDPATPVLVGAATADQHTDEPGAGVEAVELMARAARAAADDAGRPDLATLADWIAVPEGNWSYGDPGRLVAERIGARDARTVRFEIGVLQQELFTRACQVVSAGEGEVALVVGGEAKRRDQLAKRAGVALADTESLDEPNEVVRPNELGIAPIELSRGLVTSVPAVYAVIESAIRHARGETLADHRRRISELWAELGRVAAGNPAAWDRSAPSVEKILEPSDQNRMLAYPYTRLLASQWNVDQAAALIFCTVGTARRLGISEDRFVFQHSASVCNHAVPVVARRELHRSPGAATAGRAALELAGIEASDVDHVDLYSCFPAAVQVYAAELGLSLDPAPTVTGGMTFAGGPLNNYVLQALVRLAELLRAEPGSYGLSSSVSTFIHKQGFSVWSSTAPAEGFRHEDTTARVADRDDSCPIADDASEGRATVVGYTVAAEAGHNRVIAILEHDDGNRTIGQSTDPELCDRVVAEEWIGSDVNVGASGSIEA